MKEGDFIPLQSLMHNVALTPIFFSLPRIRDAAFKYRPAKLSINKVMT